MQGTLEAYVALQSHRHTWTGVFDADAVPVEVCTCGLMRLVLERESEEPMPEHDENAARAARMERLRELNERYAVEITPSVGPECSAGECRTCGADEVP